jgi:DNA-binding NtrC family response regulator
MQMKILLVDDEESLRLSLAFWLRRHKFDVTICEGAEDAAAALDQERFDCVISDLRLTRRGSEGLAILRRARNVDPQVRCILVTATPDEEFHGMLAADVGIAVSAKPIDMLDLLGLLRGSAETLPAA